jgi:hypothetical protein
MSDDPKCNICGSKKSEHVPTDKGPFTHPREAAGEGKYVRTGYGTIGFGPARDDEEWERWEFVPNEQKATA